MIRREAWEDVGPFDERFFPGMYEDNDWCDRALAKGWGLVIAPGVYIHHHGQQTFKVAGYSTKQVLAENRKRYEEKRANEVAKT
jgi:GT2 family glycosyltransferase